MLKHFSIFIAVIVFILIGFGFGNAENIESANYYSEESTACRSTSNGLAIDWHTHDKLGYADFKANKKNSKGFAIATASSNFGYEIEEDADEFKIDIFVRFYCAESWWNPRIKMDDVLSHEQLHFDICELYGRKFYQAVLQLKEEDNFNEYSVERLYEKMEQEFDDYQDLYDEETDHSTDGEMQRNWNEYVHKELKRLSAYADYYKF